MKEAPSEILLVVGNISYAIQWVKLANTVKSVSLIETAKDLVLAGALLHYKGMDKFYPPTIQLAAFLIGMLLEFLKFGEVSTKFEALKLVWVFVKR